MKTNIVGVVGRKRSGKNTISDYLVKNYGYVEYSYAEPIKRGCKEMFGFTDAQLWGTEQDKEAVDPRWGISPRRMLQLLGTELLQFDIHNHTKDGEFPIGRSVWVRKFRLWYLDEKEKNPNLKVVISDVRFLHEEEVLHGLDATIVKVIRPSIISIDGHASETELEKIIPDITFINDGTIEELYTKVEDNLKLEKPIKKNLIDVLKSSGFVQYNEDNQSFEGYDPYELVIEGEIMTETEDGHKEGIDFENFNIISITPDKMVVSAGGDWQEPVTFTLVPNGDALKVTDIVAGFEDGMTLEEIEAILS